MEKSKVSEFITKKCLQFIQDRLNEIAKKHTSVILFGAGHHAQYLLKNFDFSMFTVKGMVDSDPGTHGKILFGHEVVSPEKIEEIEADAIIVMSYETQDNIIDQLNRTLRKEIDVCALYDKDKGENMGCSLYFYELEQSTLEEKNKNLGEGYYSLYDHSHANEYFDKLSEEEKPKELIGDMVSVKALIKSNVQDEKPNICWVVMDCVRAKSLSCYGHIRKTSPFLDSLKDKSIFFEKAFSNSNWTLPSHSTMLTGKIPSEHGAWGGRNSRLSDEHVRLPELLKERGYQTIGCFGITFMHEIFGGSKGFDFYEQGPVEELIINPASVIMQTGLKQIKPGKPFFMMLNFADAHSPFKIVRHKWGKPIGDLERPLNQNLKLEPYDEAELVNTNLCYDDAIAYIDNQIAYLKSVLPENTLFIITADHGEAFNEHKGFAYNNDRAGLFEEAIHVPLLISHPRLQPKVVSGLYPLKNLHDFVVDFVDGKEEVKTEEFIICESDAWVGNVKFFGREVFAYNKACVRTDDYKLILSGDGSNYLFKLPDENTNLYSDENYTEVREKLRSILEKNSKLPLERAKGI